MPTYDQQGRASSLRGWGFDKKTYFMLSQLHHVHDPTPHKYGPNPFTNKKNIENVYCEYAELMLLWAKASKEWRDVAEGSKRENWGIAQFSEVRKAVTAVYRAIDQPIAQANPVINSNLPEGVGRAQAVVDDADTKVFIRETRESLEIVQNALSHVEQALNRSQTRQNQDIVKQDTIKARVHIERGRDMINRVLGKVVDAAGQAPPISTGKSQKWK